MRASIWCILLLAAAALLSGCDALSGAADTNQVSQVVSTGRTQSMKAGPSNNHGKRFLRTYNMSDVDTGADDEERLTLTLLPAFSVIKGVERTEADTKLLLKFWSRNNVKVEDVARKMGVFGLKQEEAVKHVNWNALVKYQTMAYKAKHGKNKFAFLAGITWTKSQTKDLLWMWLKEGATIDDVAVKLGVNQKEISKSLNGPAFLKYKKMYAKFHDRKVTSVIGGLLRNEAYTNKWLIDMLVKKESVGSVAKQLGIVGLKRKDAVSHVNWPVLVKYDRMTAFNKI
ncbi:hypothetical protein PHYBOEH_006577 [Phytophthora boehmeriae]|uniref:RxLR effector protein n=1 Tax=Phytophthora boehmeriae TaxID=109152 RepID=A0A8T1X916_9STRA|nr:hypothetical protein PHYBOEH_006577 [Phytophthora boehmeriae]